MAKKKGRNRFGKGYLNPSFKHGQYVGRRTNQVTKRDSISKLSQSALDLEETQDCVAVRHRSRKSTLERKPQSRAVRSRESTSSLGPSAEDIVQKVYSLGQDEFEQRFLSPSLLNLTSCKGHTELNYKITLYAANALPDATFKQCFSLIEDTSATHYKAAKKDRQHQNKKEEMKDAQMLYLLVEQQPVVSNFGGTEDKNERFQGFLSFTFDTEVVLPSDQKATIINVYELHLKPSAQAHGLRERLMTLIEDIGRKIGIDKTMLTVSTSNTVAETFYRRLGYSEDPISPCAKRLRNGTEKKPEYYILSKPVGESDA